MVVSEKQIKREFRLFTIAEYEKEEGPIWPGSTGRAGSW